MEETSYVGLQRFCNISRHILPSAYTEGGGGGKGVRADRMGTRQAHSPLGWNILDTNRTMGGLLGYSSENCIVSLNVPSSNGVSFGL